MAGCSSEEWKCATELPSVVVPSGKTARHSPRLQQLDQLHVDARRGARLAAFDEQGLRPRTQPADHRPAPHFGFGDETHRHHGVQHKHIQPGNVVGDDEAVTQFVQRIVVGDIDAHVEDVQQIGRPALQDASAQRQAEPRIGNGQRQAVADMQGEACGAEEGD